MTDTKEEVQNGGSWKIDRYFSSFEEADELRKTIKNKDRANMWEVKVKRCGTNGTMFVVKSRLNEAAQAELQEIEQRLVSKKKSKNQ